MSRMLLQHLLIPIVVVAFLPLCTAGLDFGSNRSSASFKLGQIGSGDVKIDESPYRTDASISFGACFDYRLAKHLSFGLGVDFHKLEWHLTSPRAYAGGGGFLLQIGPRLKGLVFSSDGKLMLRGGGGIGFGASDTLPGVGGASFLTGTATIELLLATPGTVGFGLEIGLWKTLSGSNNSVSIAIGPSSLVRAMVLF